MTTAWKQVLRPTVLVWLATAAWLVAVLALVPAAQRMGDLESDTATVELPVGADSTLVRTVLDTADGENEETVVVVVAREGGLSDADRAWLTAVRHNVSVAAQPGGNDVGPTVDAADSAAALFTVTGPDEDEIVRVLRAETSSPPTGLTAQVTGHAALDVDADNLEDGTDERLLLATVATVVVLLAFTYRSPVLWLLPLLAVSAALVLSQAAITGYAELGGEYSGLTGKILTVLVFGVGTDYALLLVSRYREELTRTAARFTAMRHALRHTAKAVLASAATVIGGVLCLLLASVPETRALGPTLALAVAVTAVVMLTLLPALLLVTGRTVFWPRIPRPGAPTPPSPAWTRISAAVTARPVRAALISAALLLSLAQGVGAVQWGLDPAGQFRNPPEAVAGLRTLAAHFPTGRLDPPVVLARPAAAAQTRALLESQPGVTAVEPTGQTAGWIGYRVHLEAAPFSRAAEDAVADLRRALTDVDGSAALVGGTAAEALDSRIAARRDLFAVAPAILAVVGVVLLLMLRSVRLTAGLLGAVALTAASAAGVTVIASRYVLDFTGVDTRIPLFAFVFVVAIGVDYSIFLLQRYREERRRNDTVSGMRRAMISTGSVVTSAGLVLAATFLVLAVLPLVPLVQLGIAVAAGILLDTLVVRTVLMPALVVLLDRTPAVDQGAALGVTTHTVLEGPDTRPLPERDRTRY
jgi:RND superfamily putative drug exporter